MLTHLSAAAVKAIHFEVLRAHGGAVGIRDERLLESAVAAPQATMAGKRLISRAVDVAAAYLFYLCRNHPFIDGNKRTALASCLVFLEINGHQPSVALPVEQWEALVTDVASGRIDRDETTARLRRLLSNVRRKRR